jgi:hypothetical protein
MVCRANKDEYTYNGQRYALLKEVDHEIEQLKESE